MSIDGGTSSFAVSLDSVCGGYYKGVNIYGFSTAGLSLKGTTGTCSWNSFINLTLFGGASGTGCIWLQGFLGQGNACHNSFQNIAINFYGSNNGINLGGCDNNAFFMTYIYCAPGSTGYGVIVDPSQMTNFPINNTFFHLEASTRGWYQPATTAVQPALIYGYMQDNGQPGPITNNTYLPSTYSRGNYVIAPGGSIGYSAGANFGGAFNFPSGVSSVAVGFPYGNEPDTGYTIFISPEGSDLNQTWFIGNKTTSGFTVYLNSATSSSHYCKFMVVRF